jgi:hypothetical protein
MPQIKLSDGTYLTRRCYVKRGQMFVLERPWFPHLTPNDILVVLDNLSETGFWNGGRYCLGDMAPDVLVQVIS